MGSITWIGLRRRVTRLGDPRASHFASHGSFDIRYERGRKAPAKTRGSLSTPTEDTMRRFLLFGCHGIWRSRGGWRDFTEGFDVLNQAQARARELAAPEEGVTEQMVVDAELELVVWTRRFEEGRWVELYSPAVFRPPSQ